MDSLKFIFGVLLFLLCMLAVGVLIWIMLFGIPQKAMDGGTLVNSFHLLKPMAGKWIMRV